MPRKKQEKPASGQLTLFDMIDADIRKQDEEKRRIKEAKQKQETKKKLEKQKSQKVDEAAKRSALETPEIVIANTRKGREYVHPEAQTEKIQRKHGRGMTQAERRARYRSYGERKKIAFEFEKTNDEYLVLTKCSDYGVEQKTFYVMGGPSALIYVHDLAPKMGRTATLRTDEDDGAKWRFKTGVAYILNLEALLRGLEAKVGKIEIVNKEGSENGDIVYIKLPRKYPKAEISGMHKIEKRNKDNFYGALYPRDLFPDINKMILILKRILPPKVGKIKHEYARMFSNRVAFRLEILMVRYSEIAHGTTDKVVAAREMVQAGLVLLEYTSMFVELGVWTVAEATRIADIIIGMNRQIKGKIINKAIEESKNADKKH